MSGRLPRTNMVYYQAEAWRPPPFHRVVTRLDATKAAARRFLDLQAGSIWADLKALLPDCRGIVLDVGCGAQPYRHLLAAGAQYRGIDHVYAREHFGYEMPDTTYYDGERWPVESGSVDVVLATETLEHVPEPVSFLAEAARCARPGGRIILTVPFAARWHYIPHDYWRFTPSSLRQMLEDAGFANVEIYARGNAVTVACYKVIALILPLLMPSTGGPAARWLARTAGLLCSPALPLLAVIAQLSLRSAGGADCLGYTVVAARP
ncbi:MAG: methyltransferase domain-containing protein [Isosphaeraceae bacterium]